MVVISTFFSLTETETCLGYNKAIRRCKSSIFGTRVFDRIVFTTGSRMGDKLNPAPKESGGGIVSSVNI